MQAAAAQESVDVILPLHFRALTLAQTSIEAPELPRSLYQAAGKRGLDVLLVVLAMPLWLPVYLVVAATILVMQGRPVHFVSRRPGRNGSLIPMLKFRTMRLGAETILSEVFAQDPELRDEFKRCNKLQKDPRVTRLGAFLRRTSLDEVPQLWNVLRGHMSLVGPRPPWADHELETFYGDMAAPILRHRPGLTGQWQVSRHPGMPYERKVWLDLQYSFDCSLATDVRILAKTATTVVRGSGSY
jgi:exopolysaccharide production protein ExoY